ncbi:MAG: hypothetical protein QG665_240 [Patescibacteria group bacterium]|nr:hypothetical protein [Patescibacteria group bacterium]
MIGENSPIAHPPVTPDWNPETGTPTGHISPYPRPVLAIAGDVLVLLLRLELKKEERWTRR